MGDVTTTWQADNPQEALETLAQLRTAFGYEAGHTEVTVGAVENYDDEHTYTTDLDNLGEPAYGEIVSIDATTLIDETAGRTAHFDYTRSSDDQCRLDLEMTPEEMERVEEYLEQEAVLDDGVHLT